MLYFSNIIPYSLLFIPYFQQLKHNMCISNNGGRSGVVIFSIAISPLRGAIQILVFSANIVERHPSLLAESTPVPNVIYYGTGTPVGTFGRGEGGEFE